MKDSFGFPQTVLSLSGSSEIAFAMLKQMKSHGLQQCYIGGRSDHFMEEYKKELEGIELHHVKYDADKYEMHAEVLTRLFEKLTIDMVIYGAGLLHSNEECYSNKKKALDMASVNYVGGMNSLMLVKELMEKQGFGTIILISSVAAMIGRVKGYVYSSSKAALDTFAHGMLLELYNSPIQFFILRPGLVKTKMTAPYKTAMKAVTPESVASDMIKQLHRKNKIVYSPGYMRYVMNFMQIMPLSLQSKIKI
jgi:decaprenylphospho-beta-D-erythro-pentofuranosid-2-ulose 2-reductase